MNPYGRYSIPRSHRDRAGDTAKDQQDGGIRYADSLSSRHSEPDHRAGPVRGRVSALLPTAGAVCEHPRSSRAPAWRVRSGWP